MAKSAAPLLLAQNVTAGYGRVQVLQPTSLELARGQFLALIGPNGSGKSTLLRTLAGLIKPWAGRVRLEGTPLDRLSRAAIAQKIAVVPQTETPAWPLPVQEVVAMGRIAHRGWWRAFNATDRAAVAEAIKVVGIAPLAERPVTELSGGEWQLVLFARALAQQPAILLLDEPTAHLDLAHQHRVMVLCREAARRGLAVVAAIHDLNQAAQWADRVAVLSGGRLISVGLAAEVLIPTLLQSVYGIPVSVCVHPVLGSPLVAVGTTWPPGPFA